MAVTLLPASLPLGGTLAIAARPAGLSMAFPLNFLLFPLLFSLLVGVFLVGLTLLLWVPVAVVPFFRLCLETAFHITTAVPFLISFFSHGSVFFGSALDFHFPEKKDGVITNCVAQVARTNSSCNSQLASGARHSSAIFCLLPAQEAVAEGRRQIMIVLLVAFSLSTAGNVLAGWLMQAVVPLSPTASVIVAAGGGRGASFLVLLLIIILLKGCRFGRSRRLAAALDLTRLVPQKHSLAVLAAFLQIYVTRKPFGQTEHTSVALFPLPG